MAGYTQGHFRVVAAAHYSAAIHPQTWETLNAEDRGGYTDCPLHFRVIAGPGARSSSAAAGFAERG